MKRFLSILIVLLLLAVPAISANAAGNAELGELLISSPEKVTGNVGDVVKVNFFLYPNLPEGRKLGSLSGSMKYDPDFVTLGAISQTDEENNLTSLMKGKASMFQPNLEERGIMRFVFIDAYGVEAEGFWFQAEFRIEKEGATDFVFNGIEYSGVDDEYKSDNYYIEPVSVGGIYTEGEEVPSDGAAEETFEPIEALIETPAPVTATPEPSNGGQTVPITSTLPTFSAKPTLSGVVTPPPAVTSIPITTSEPRKETASPNPNVPDPDAQGSAAPDPLATPNGEQGGITTETSAAPNDPTNPGTDPAAEETGENTEKIKPVGPNDPLKPNTDKLQEKPNTLIVAGVIIGIVAALGLGALAIVLILKRRKLEE